MREGGGERVCPVPFLSDTRISATRASTHETPISELPLSAHFLSSRAAYSCWPSQG